MLQFDNLLPRELFPFASSAPLALRYQIVSVYSMIPGESWTWFALFSAGKSRLIFRFHAQAFGRCGGLAFPWPLVVPLDRAASRAAGRAPNKGPSRLETPLLFELAWAHEVTTASLFPVGLSHHAHLPVVASRRKVRRRWREADSWRCRHP